MMANTPGPSVTPILPRPASSAALPEPAMKPIAPDNSIGVRELKNNLTRIVSTVRNEQREYVVTVHGQPVAVLRPYTEDDAFSAWQEACDQEMEAMLETAKRVSAAWKSAKTGAEILAEMREESACR